MANARNAVAPGRKYSTKHPYAAIEHRVIDSPAYADLTFSARSLLVLMTRQLTKDNNGHLQATYSFLQPLGFDSEHTISRAITDLIAHGMIYRTRSGGFHQGPSQYAVTWLSVTKRDGLFLQGFKLCAWRDWQPEQKKSRPPKVQLASCINGMRTPPIAAESAASPPPKSADNELMPCRGSESTGLSIIWHNDRPPASGWIPGYLADLDRNGLAGHQCFQLVVAE